MIRMTQSRVDMLAALRALAPVTATVLGDVLGVHSSSARTVLGGLWRLGLVGYDTAGPGVGRGPRPQRWYLTAAGTAAARAGADGAVSEELAVTGRMPPRCGMMTEYDAMERRTSTADTASGFGALAPGRQGGVLPGATRAALPATWSAR
jgi:hypothetical protein